MRTRGALERQRADPVSVPRQAAGRRKVAAGRREQQAHAVVHAAHRQQHPAPHTLRFPASY